MTTEALHDRFLGILQELGGQAGNGKLREKLGLDENSYTALRAEMLAQGLISLDRGRGGSVVLVGRIVPVAVTIAVGVNSDGRREVLGMAIG
ncbi:hypothetical protein GGQ83_003978 [Roseococcus suduntuyensis]|uniref:Uncharacterized protein n=1 Tax=Roseococcus suduntuyensis TaxID=455361 RepID=A0A840AHD8_9PROT|nr:hypothetical protein [Roseococcus suduntuyensis]